LLSPGAFIPSAEESGLIRAIGKWVLRTACLEAVDWQRRHPSVASASVSVNVSPSEFGSREFVTETARILDQTGMDPSRLKLEITETALMQDIEGAMATMHGLKLLGVKLAIDDFGTGYSSLNYLRRFPVDTLKVDQSFVREMDRDARVRSIVEVIIGLAHGLDMDVTAEGIETTSQLRCLIDAGADRGQGYLFARPLPVEALGDFLKAQDDDLNEEPPLPVALAD
jgi:EAL domain-containing protein (putative c-di-GMP-specific phosphodiesterase class I)